MVPQMVDEGFILHWDIAPVHTAHIVTNFLASKEGVEVLRHPPIVLIWHLATSSSSPR